MARPTTTPRALRERPIGVTSLAAACTVAVWDSINPVIGA